MNALAAAAHANPFHFLRVFSRLKRAAQSLSNGTLPVGAVALAGGFGDLSTFAREFKRTFGCSPTEYRA